MSCVCPSVCLYVRTSCLTSLLAHILHDTKHEVNGEPHTTNKVSQYQVSKIMWNVFLKVVIEDSATNGAQQRLTKRRTRDKAWRAA